MAVAGTVGGRQKSGFARERSSGSPIVDHMRLRIPSVMLPATSTAPADTPQRHLFANDARAYSHGCIRVQHPREFAQVVLGWDEYEVSSAVEAGENRHVSLTRKIPVHVTYFTLWPDDSGKLVVRGDMYKRDQALKRALSATRVALN